MKQAVVYINGYGLTPIQATKPMPKERAMDMCERENLKLIKSGVPREVLILNPSYHFFRVEKEE